MSTHNGGKKLYRGITSTAHMKSNLRAHCLPETMLEGVIPAYSAFLEERRRLMALKIKQCFETL